MEFWEFLLQKEGDRTWLPLEAAKVEILEGRYRVMANSSHIDESVEIRISQILLDETPPKRRVLKRTSRTNQDGLMVVMPFTRLQPGDWELQCHHQNDWRYSVQLQVLSQEDETSGDWNPNWEDANDGDIKHRAAAAVKATGDAPDADSNPPPRTPVNELGEVPKPKSSSPPETTASKQVTPSSQPASPAPSEETASNETVKRAITLADQLSRQIVDSIFKDIEQTLGNSTSDNAALTATSSNSDAPSATSGDNGPPLAIPACAIDLNQSAFMLQGDRPLAVSGQIIPTQASDPPEAKLPTSELRIHLRNPNNSEILLAQTVPLQVTKLPAHFDVELELPTSLPTRLMLGEIALLLESGHAAKVWTSRAFTVTAPIHDLLEAIANEAEGQDDLDYVHISPETEPSSDQESASEETDPLVPNDFALPSLSQAKLVFQPLEKQPLPPQLTSPDPDPAGDKPLILPNFPSLSQPQTAKQDPPAVEKPVADKPLSERSESDAMETSAPLESSPTDSPESLPTDPLKPPLANPLNAPETNVLSGDLDPDDGLQEEDVEAFGDPQQENTGFEPLDDELAASTIEAMGEEADDSAQVTLPTVDLAFQALNLQERFWSRLSALSTEGYEEAAEYKSAIEAAGVRTSADESEEQALQDAWGEQVLSREGQIELDLHLAEEIVVYEEPLEAAPVENTTDAGVANLIEETSEIIASEDDSERVTPAPNLKVPAVELTAGEMISIEVSLPAQESRTYVKLWISDPQTRTLLDQPRWLMDLQPNGADELMASLRLKVPQGCTEARFTAIAVNMVTQQESYKTVVDRTVFPPNLPLLALDEFEI